jgi:hypothetical protein
MIPSGKRIPMTDPAGRYQLTWMPADTTAELEALKHIGALALSLRRSAPAPRHAATMAAARHYAAANYR